jgi:hypothetical protein
MTAVFGRAGCACFLLRPTYRVTSQKGGIMKQWKLDTTELARFTGTKCWYRHALNGEVLFTEGAKYVADHVGAYWLLDEIALIQPYDKRVGAEGFQVWKLNVKTDMTAELICEDGDDNVVYIKKIPFTDFPREGITFWFTENTILLPTEY